MKYSQCAIARYFELLKSNFQFTLIELVSSSEDVIKSNGF